MEFLLSGLDKKGIILGLLKKSVDIEDVSYSSKYFDISEISSIFTAGRNPVAFNGTNLLKSGSEIQVECVDSGGNSLYLERAKSKDNQFTDISNFVVSIHVYEETYNGPAKLILVGTTKKGEIVRWIGNITIDKTLSNSSKVRFYINPSLEVRPLLYPIVDLDLATDEDPPPENARAASATANISSIVQLITVTNVGSGYISTPSVTISGGGGSGAVATATVESETVTSITILNSGNGYTSAPTVTISGGGGSGATATATLLSTVDSITITDGGARYETAPIVTITGYGSGASAVATITDGVVTNISVTNGGNGYVQAPTVTFTSPDQPAAPELNVTVNFSAQIYGFAVDPKKDTTKISLDKKRIDFDYRLVATNISNENLEPTLFPTASFNTQMEGQTIDLTITKIKVPLSNRESPTSITTTATIKKVLDPKTIIIENPFYYQVGKDQFIADIVDGECSLSYDYIKYNTNPESNLTYQPSSNVTPVSILKSYAEITYRNIKTFSGFVARHKLYRRSLFHPGEFQLLSNELLGASELLLDPITFNKSYNKLGTFYNQFHIDKYLYPSSANLTLEAKTFPINSVFINGGTDYSQIDGTDYVIIKTDSIGIENDNQYYAYDETEFNRLSGNSYNSNFISLKKDTLYSLSVNSILEKDKLDPNAKVTFYFKSSIESIQLESDYIPEYGLKIGEISTKDLVSKKYFSDINQFYFTPSDDYYGTIIIVPYRCNVTLSNLSLKVYGDYGFSPDVLVINIPFPINIKNEAFEIKSELFDINSNLIYSNLNTVKTFDIDGESLVGSTSLLDNFDKYIIFEGTTNNNRTVSLSNNVTVNGSLNLPHLEPCDGSPHRFIAWEFPSDESGKGQLCYTPVSNLYIQDTDYIVLTTVSQSIETTVQALAIRYNGDLNQGRRIYILENGTISGSKVSLP